MKPVIYLTGAPATGKSTLARNLRDMYPELSVFAYSEQLREQIALRSGGNLAEDEIRSHSARVVTAQDIEALDRRLAAFVREKRAFHPILIDSHAVTKENYGFRVTSFSTDSLLAVNPDVIVCLYASSEVVIQRIGANPMGRPNITHFEATMHTQLQTGLAVYYGVVLGKPVYLIDSAIDEASLVRVVSERSKLAV